MISNATNYPSNGTSGIVQSIVPRTKFVKIVRAHAVGSREMACLAGMRYQVVCRFIRTQCMITVTRKWWNMV